MERPAPNLIGRRRCQLLLALVIALSWPLAGGVTASEPEPSEADSLVEVEVVEAEPDPLFDDDFGFEVQPAGFPDPFETPNRAVLSFNQAVDALLLDPVTRLFRFVLPEPARRALNRFFDNVNSPQVIVNDMLQLEWRDAWTTTARLGINSSIGLAGFFDPARSFGLEHHVSDFGQTLAMAGAPSGTYLVLPLLGPTTIRDGIGLGVDSLFHPTFYVLGGTDLIFFGGTAGVSTRARHYEELKALEESSVDFYAALRSGYYQNRIGEIWSRRQERRPDGAQ